MSCEKVQTDPVWQMAWWVCGRVLFSILCSMDAVLFYVVFGYLETFLCEFITCIYPYHSWLLYWHWAIICVFAPMSVKWHRSIWAKVIRTKANGGLNDAIGNICDEYSRISSAEILAFSFWDFYVYIRVSIDTNFTGLPSKWLKLITSQYYVHRLSLSVGERSLYDKRSIFTYCWIHRISFSKHQNIFVSFHTSSQNKSHHFLAIPFSKGLYGKNIQGRCLHLAFNSKKLHMLIQLYSSSSQARVQTILCDTIAFVSYHKAMSQNNLRLFNTI